MSNLGVSRSFNPNNPDCFTTTGIRMSVSCLQTYSGSNLDEETASSPPRVCGTGTVLSLVLGTGQGPEQDEIVRRTGNPMTGRRVWLEPTHLRSLFLSLSDTGPHRLWYVDSIQNLGDNSTGESYCVRPVVHLLHGFKSTVRNGGGEGKRLKSENSDANKSDNYPTDSSRKCKDRPFKLLIKRVDPRFWFRVAIPLFQIWIWVLRD